MTRQIAIEKISHSGHTGALSKQFHQRLNNTPVMNTFHRLRTLLTVGLMLVITLGQSVAASMESVSLLSNAGDHHHSQATATLAVDPSDASLSDTPEASAAHPEASAEACDNCCHCHGSHVFSLTSLPELLANGRYSSPLARLQQTPAGQPTTLFRPPRLLS